jgi:hypothetical protein
MSIVRRVIAILPLLGCNAVLGIDSPIHADAAADVANEPDAPEMEAACMPDGTICSVAPQCGCENRTCAVVDTSGTLDCVDIGTTPRWWPCTALVGACGFGDQCIGGACKPLCVTNADCGGGACIQITTTGDPRTGTDIPNLKVCSSGCDPLNPSGVCGPGVNCMAVFKTKTATTSDCIASAGNAMGVGGCANNPAACAPGWMCLGAGAHMGDCSKFCRMLHPEDCPMNQSCENFQPHFLFNGAEYGTCN